MSYGPYKECDEEEGIDLVCPNCNTVLTYIPDPPTLESELAEAFNQPKEEDEEEGEDE